jgi:hypothetical protein
MNSEEPVTMIRTSKPGVENPPAFARPIGVLRKEDCEFNDSQQGMSLREYLAAKAMQGILASTNSTGTAPWPDPLWLAEKSYKYADAMLKEGQKS